MGEFWILEFGSFAKKKPLHGVHASAEESALGSAFSIFLLCCPVMMVHEGVWRSNPGPWQGICLKRSLACTPLCAQGPHEMSNMITEEWTAADQL